jgi:hypothetical protein
MVAPKACLMIHSVVSCELVDQVHRLLTSSAFCGCSLECHFLFSRELCHLFRWSTERERYTVEKDSLVMVWFFKLAGWRREESLVMVWFFKLAGWRREESLVMVWFFKLAGWRREERLGQPRKSREGMEDRKKVCHQSRLLCQFSEIWSKIANWKMQIEDSWKLDFLMHPYMYHMVWAISY